MFGTLNWSLPNLSKGSLRWTLFMFQNVLHLNFTTHFSGAALFDTVQFNLWPKQRETMNATSNLCRTSLQRGTMNPIWIVHWILVVVVVNLCQYLQLTLASLASSGYLLFYSNRREAWTNTNTIAHRQRWLYLLLRGEYTPHCTGQGKVTSGHVVGAVIVLGHYYGPDCVSLAHKIFVIKLKVNSKWLYCDKIQTVCTFYCSLQICTLCSGPALLVRQRTT